MAPTWATPRRCTSASVAVVSAAVAVGGGGGGGGVGPGELPAACVTVTTAPAMPRLPTRLSDVVFGATANRRLPDPVSPTPPSITIQGTPETAVHEHVAAEALTRTSMAPPSAPTDAASGDTVSSQPGSPCREVVVARGRRSRLPPAR